MEGLCCAVSFLAWKVGGRPQLEFQPEATAPNAG